MDAPKIRPKELGAEQFSMEAWQKRFNGSWPLWARMAVVRFGRILLPSVKKERFLACFDKEDGYAGLLNEFASAAVQGRFARFLAETRTAAPDMYRQILSDQFSPENPMAIMVRQAFDLPVPQQIKHWKEFSKGFSRPVMLKQEVRAFRFYLIVIICWPRIEMCRSIREAYDFVFTTVPKEPCPEGEDPIDHEERQFKWFEKICQRNLGLKLRDRGRAGNTPKGG